VAIPTAEEEEEDQELQGGGDDDDYGAADWCDAAVAWEDAARARSKQAEAAAAVARARSNQVAEEEEVEEMADFIGFGCYLLLLLLVFTCAFLLWLGFR
jgi:hypothetical protein